MADVTGPISTLPGSSHTIPAGTMCDDHPDRRATHRIQGETDLFGSEMNDYCDECYNKIKAEIAAARNEASFCDWCKQEKIGCRSHRDFEEGMSGPVYNVCPECRKKENEFIREEMEEFDKSHADDF